MHLDLIAIKTDTCPLDGLFYQPECGACAGAVLLMHGNCKNFYTGPARFLPPLSPGWATRASPITGAATMWW